MVVEIITIRDYINLCPTPLGEVLSLTFFLARLGVSNPMKTMPKVILLVLSAQRQSLTCLLCYVGHLLAAFPPRPSSALGYNHLYFVLTIFSNCRVSSCNIGNQPDPATYQSLFSVISSQPRRVIIRPGTIMSSLMSGSDCSCMKCGETEHAMWSQDIQFITSRSKESKLKPNKSLLTELSKSSWLDFVKTLPQLRKNEK